MVIISNNNHDDDHDDDHGEFCLFFVFFPFWGIFVSVWFWQAGTQDGRIVGMVCQIDWNKIGIVVKTMI